MNYVLNVLGQNTSHEMTSKNSMSLSSMNNIVRKHGAEAVG